MTKEEEYLIILKKLAKNGPQTRPDFERPRFKANTVFSGIESVPEKDDFIPHSTLIDRLKDLIEIEAIEEFDSGKKSKKKLPIMEYDISLLGIIKMLQLCNEHEFQSDILPNIYRLSIIWYFVKPLTKVFSRTQIYETLVHVCKNTTVVIEKDPMKVDLTKYHIPLISAYDLLKGKNGIKTFIIESKVDQLHSSCLLTNKFSAYGKKLKEKVIFSNIKPISEINNIVTAMFFHELIFRCSNPSYLSKKYPFQGKRILLQWINSEKQFKTIYSNFLQKIKNQQLEENQILFEIESKIN